MEKKKIQNRRSDYLHLIIIIIILSLFAHYEHQRKTPHLDIPLTSTPSPLKSGFMEEQASLSYSIQEK